MSHVSLLKGKDRSVGLECVPAEQDGEVRVTCVRDELVRDLRDVITGYLWDNCMKPSTSRPAFWHEAAEVAQWMHHVYWPRHCECVLSKNVTVGVPASEGRRSRP